MAEEKRATSSLRTEQPEFESDTTGNVKIDGVRHVMQEEMEAAGLGVFERVPAPENKSRKAAPEEGAPVSVDTAPTTPKRATRRASRRK